MELPIRFLVLLVLAIIVLFGIIMLINPIQSGSATAQQMADRNNACSNWSINKCKETSQYLESVEKAFGCSGVEACKKSCLSIKFCQITE